MRALRDMNMPKFVYEDVPLFKGLIKDLFPGIEASRVGYEDLNILINEYLEKNGFKHSDQKCYET
jgi:dynein heavy chain